MKTYLKFINENLSEKIHMSDELIKKLKSMNNNFANAILLLNKKNDIELIPRYATNLDILSNSDGILISYVFNADINGNRMKTKPTKILNKIIKDVNELKKYQNFEQKDIEDFMNKWNVDSKDEIRVEEWSGEKILEGFNYTDKLSYSFSSSCANFNVKDNPKRKGKWSYGWEDPEKEWYDVYIQNKNNIKLIVALRYDIILGRRIIVEGEQYKDSGSFKKGTYYTYVSNYYGEGGEGSLVDNKIMNYIRKTKENVFMPHEGVGSVIIQLDVTDFNKYPPFDSAYIDNKNRLFASDNPYDGEKWISAYKAGVGNRPMVKMQYI